MHRAPGGPGIHFIGEYPSQIFGGLVKNSEFNIQQHRLRTHKLECVTFETDETQECVMLSDDVWDEACDDAIVKVASENGDQTCAGVSF